MAVTIAGSVGTSMSAATGRPGQSHLMYGTNNSKWYLMFLSSTNLLSLAYSTDFSSWTTSGTTLTLSNAHGSEGRNFGFKCDNISSNDVVHMVSGYGATTTAKLYHTRFTLGATAFTTTNAETTVPWSINSTTTNTPIGPTVQLDSSNRPFDSYETGNGDAEVARGSNIDAGTSWTAGFATGVLVDSSMTANITSTNLAALASGNMLNVTDNGPTTGTFTNLRWTKYTTSWSTAANVLVSSGTSTSSNNWGMVATSVTDVHVVALSNNSNTYVHRRFNGTSWSAGQTIPSLAYAANSGIFLATDNTNVWLFVIDSSYNVKYIKWTASNTSWDTSWTTLDAGGASARSYISGFQRVTNNKIGLIWTQVNGTNFNIMGALLDIPVTQQSTSPSSILFLM